VIDAPPQGGDWQRVELLRRLYRVIQETSLVAVSRQTGIAKATLYRWFWRERRPSTMNLLALYRTYPTIFVELKILEEDRESHS
jgi:hypothetical protein